MDKKNLYAEINAKNCMKFEDTSECITQISEMVNKDIRVDYSVNPPVLHIDCNAINVGDYVGILENGEVFVVPSEAVSTNEY